MGEIDAATLLVFHEFEAGFQSFDPTQEQRNEMFIFVDFLRAWHFRIAQMALQGRKQQERFSRAIGKCDASFLFIEKNRIFGVFDRLGRLRGLVVLLVDFMGDSYAIRQ